MSSWAARDFPWGDVPLAEKQWWLYWVYGAGPVQWRLNGMPSALVVPAGYSA